MTAELDRDPAPFPLRAFLGMDVLHGPEGAVTRCSLAGEALNPNGTVHGGVLFTMVDTAMGRATLDTLGDGRRCASIEIHIRFLRPVVGGLVEARARVVKPGRRIVHVGAEVVDGESRVVATATGTFAVLEP